MNKNNKKMIFIIYFVFYIFGLLPFKYNFSKNTIKSSKLSIFYIFTILIFFILFNIPLFTLLSGNLKIQNTTISVVGQVVMIFQTFCIYLQILLAYCLTLKNRFSLIDFVKKILNFYQQLQRIVTDKQKFEGKAQTEISLCFKINNFQYVYYLFVYIFTSFYETLATHFLPYVINGIFAPMIIIFVANIFSSITLLLKFYFFIINEEIQSLINVFVLKTNNLLIRKQKRIEYYYKLSERIDGLGIMYKELYDLFKICDKLFKINILGIMFVSFVTILSDLFYNYQFLLKNINNDININGFNILSNILWNAYQYFIILYMVYSCELLISEVFYFIIIYSYLF